MNGTESIAPVALYPPAHLYATDHIARSMVGDVGWGAVTGAHCLQDVGAPSYRGLVAKNKPIGHWVVLEGVLVNSQEVYFFFHSIQYC